MDWLQSGVLALSVVATEKVLWQFRNQKDTDWKDMPTFYSDLHEGQFADNVVYFEYDVQYAKGTKNYHYCVDLNAWTQSNQNTGKVRRIRRVVERLIEA